jgi:gas vesicle protein
LGRAIYQIKNASDDLKSEIKKTTGDIKNELNIKELIKETEEDIKLPMDQMMTDIEHTINYEPKKNKKDEQS